MLACLHLNTLSSIDMSSPGHGDNVLMQKNYCFGRFFSRRDLRSVEEKRICGHFFLWARISLTLQRQAEPRIQAFQFLYWQYLILQTPLLLQRKAFHWSICKASYPLPLHITVQCRSHYSFIFCLCPPSPPCLAQKLFFCQDLPFSFLFTFTFPLCCLKLALPILNRTIFLSWFFYHVLTVSAILWVLLIWKTISTFF